MKKIINVKGMTCGHCVNGVENIISSIEGVSSVKVSLENENAVVVFENIEIESILEEINDTNYKASLEKE